MARSGGRGDVLEWEGVQGVLEGGRGVENDHAYGCAGVSVGGRPTSEDTPTTHSVNKGRKQGPEPHTRTPASQKHSLTPEGLLTLSATRSALPHRVYHAAEIGRASCRERV